MASKANYFLLLTIISLCLVGGFFIYFVEFSTGEELKPTPHATVSSNLQEIQAKKAVENFLNYYLSSRDDANLAQKAKDLLTISAQAKLLTAKNEQGQTITDIPSQLNTFMGVQAPPQSFEFLSFQDAERGVEVRVSFVYNQRQNKIFVLEKENNLWLIDEVNGR